MKIRVNRFVILGIVMLAGGVPFQALGETLEGIVHVAGNALSTEVLLTEKGSYKGPNLCRTAEAKRIGQIAGMRVRVGGSWQLRSDGSKRCFEPQSFKVLRTTRGQKPVVGVLSKHKGSYVITEAAGKVHRFSQIPEGLKRLTGEKVILEVSPLNHPASNEAAAQVVSYTPFP